MMIQDLSDSLTDPTHLKTETYREDDDFTTSVIFIHFPAYLISLKLNDEILLTQ